MAQNKILWPQPTYMFMNFQLSDYSILMPVYENDPIIMPVLL